MRFYFYTTLKPVIKTVSLSRHHDLCKKIHVLCQVLFFIYSPLLKNSCPWWACRNGTITHLALEHHFEAAERHVGPVRVLYVPLWCLLHVCRSWWSVSWWSVWTLVGGDGLFSLPALFQCAQGAGVQSDVFHGLEENHVGKKKNPSHNYVSSVWICKQNKKKIKITQNNQEEIFFSKCNATKSNKKPGRNLTESRCCSRNIPLQSIVQKRKNNKKTTRRKKKKKCLIYT